MIAAAGNRLPRVDSIAGALRLARTESAVVGEPTVPFTREKGMRLETEVTLELQNAATALDSARAELWALIEDSRPLPDEILQSAIRYWAAVRKLRLWLGEYGQLGVRLEARFDLRNEVLKNSGVEEEIDCGG